MFFSSAYIASAFLLASTQASRLHNELSFGHGDRISPSLRAIPNFHLIGNPNYPEILSNKIILTPPAPGNSRGGIWAEKQLMHSEWTIDLDFRATGPDRGGGNLQVWYAHNGQRDIGTSSIYTVGKFDGLAIVIDQYAGSGGFVRGFLNDGSKEYKNHHAVDSLAFGHCTYPYRNRGTPSRLAITHLANLFRVSLDGNLCFESTKIKLPLGYNFGISAASAENPDSFEVFKFITTTEAHTPDFQDPNQANQQNFLGAKKIEEKPGHSPKDEMPTFSDMPEVAATQVNSNEQFADLHNRLQGLTRHITTLTRDNAHYINLAAARHEALLSLVNSISSSTANIPSVISKLDRLDNLERKIDKTGEDVRQMKSDFHNALDLHANNIRNDVKNTHGTLLGTVKAGSMGWLGWLGVVFCSQVVTVVAYVVYKRRKNGGHQKYL